ncbi:MAG: RHS repeat-associated core domain-containing protein [Aliiglaciecola sp.]|uniref:RHS repeat-associated core domain-containing protein n=1 Tax=Aliiglaciecola sp. TaxID=1872441 RepID=UPI00329759A8
MLFRIGFFLLLFTLSGFASAGYFTNLPPSPNGTGNYTLSWTSESSDSGAYFLYETVGGSTTQVHSGYGSSKSFSGQANGNYSYELRGLQETWVGGEPMVRNVSMDTFSLTVNILSIPPKMGTPSAPSTDNDYSIAVTWPASSGQSITQYQLQVKKDSGGYSTKYTGSSRSYTYTAAADGVYYFRVRAYNEAGWGAYSSTDSTISSKTPGVPSSISGVPSTSSTGSFTVSWGSSSGTLDRYKLYQQKNSGSWTLIYSGGSRSKTVSLDDGTHKYRVKACNTTSTYEACSGYRTSGESKVAKTPGVPSSISGVPSTTNSGSFTVSWGTSTGSIDRYRLYQQKNNGSWTQIYSGTSRSKAVSLGDGTYKFRVRACNSTSTYESCSGYRTSNESLVAKKPGVPSSISGVPGTTNSGSFTISWGVSSGTVDTYKLYQKINGGSWSQIYSGTTRSKAVSIGDGTYQFTVKACNSTGSYETCSGLRTSNESLVAKTPGVPSSISGVPGSSGSGSFTITWGASSGTVDTYKLYKKLNGGGWTQIYSGTTRSKAVSLIDGTYQFTVKACNSTGSYETCSGLRTSGESKVAITPGVPSSISGVPSMTTSGQFTVSWGAATGNVNHYRLYQRVDGGTYSQIYSGTSLSKSISLTSDGIYQYRVRACNVTGSYNACSGYKTSSSANAELDPIPAPLNTISDQSVSSLNGDAMQSDLVGEIKGNFKVDGGAFSYSVPIAIPPGRKGMQPSVSLNYSSQNGAGLAGYGWNLSAGGQIHRCSNIYDLDDSTLSVLYDSADKLCFNGSRLIATNKADYGKVNTEYRTERDPGFTIKQLGGTLAQTNAYFIVYYPDGKTSTYGISGNAKVTRSGHSVPERWLLELESDTYENEVKYSYSSETGNKYLANIYYTGHNGTLGTRRAKFIYDTINSVENYSFGGKSVSNKLLSRIEIWIDNEIKSNWRINHSQPNNDNVHNYYRVDSLQYCEDNAASNCLTTNFDWLQMDYNYTDLAPDPNYDDARQILQITDQFKVGEPIEKASDFDGDGVFDVTSGEGIYLSDGGFVPGSDFPIWPDEAPTESTDNSSFKPHLPILGHMDYNLDGKTDIVYKGTDGKLIIATIVNGNKQFLYNTQIDATCYLSYANLQSMTFCPSFVIDFNGDGRQDLLVATKAETSNQYDSIITYKAYLRNESGAGFSFAGEFPYNLNSAQSSSLAPIDVNGDGLIDIAHANVRDTAIWLQTSFNANNQTVSFTQKSVNLNTTYDTTKRRNPGRWIDLNGDGLQDILTLGLANPSDDLYSFYAIFNKGNGQFTAAVNTGREELAELTYNDIVSDQDEGQVRNSFIKILDFNGDGRQDLLVPTTKGPYTYQCYDHATNQDCVAVDGAESPRFHSYDVYHWEVWLTDESGSTFTTYELDDEIIGALATMSIIDVNGDGLDDFVSGIGFESSAQKRRWYYGSKTGGAGNNPRGFFIFERDATDENVIHRVSTGMGTKAEVAYTQLKHVLTSDTGLAAGVGHPYVNFSNTMRVVERFETDNGLGSLNPTTYEYSTPVAHIAGRGFQGFKKIIETSTDVNSEHTTETEIEFYQAFPWSGMVKSKTQRDADNQQLMSTYDVNSYFPNNNEYVSGESFCFYPSETETHSYKEGDVETTVITTQNDLCQTTFSKKTVDDDSTILVTEVDTVYVTMGSNYIKLPKTVENTKKVTFNLSGLPTGERQNKKTKTIYSYTPEFAVYKIEIMNSSNDTVRETSIPNFDIYGNPLKVSIGDRWTTSTMTDDGYFVQATQNRQWGANIDVSFATYDRLTGAMLTQKDVQGILTTNTINFLGSISKTRVTKNGQNIVPPVYTQLTWESGDYAVRVKTVQDGAPITMEYKDSLGRTIKQMSTAFNGTWVTSETFYDARGNVVKQSTPTSYFSQQDSVKYENYDIWGRPEYKVQSDGLVGYTSWYTYNGQTTTIDVGSTSLALGESVNDIGNSSPTVGTMSRTYNSLGQLLKTVDVKGSATYYAYDSAGNPDYIKDAKGNIITAQYNDIGEKLSFDDPNMGTWNFTYNEFGELATQTDANGNVSSPSYDFMGRVTGVNGRTWDYDNNNDKGLLFSTNSGDGEVKTFTYDSLSRIKTVATQIDGLTFNQEFAYHSILGTMKGEKTPSGEVLGYTYNDYGYLTSEFRHLETGDEILRQIDSMDALGNVKVQKFGTNIYQKFTRTATGAVQSVCAGTNSSCNNAYQNIDYDFDGMGNLTKQHNLITGFKEEYVYDELMRVQAAQVKMGSMVVANYDYDYDVVGNILNKSDYASSFTYNTSRSQGGNAGPNAVRRIAKGGSNYYFTYDNNGNMLTGNGLTQTVYNKDNKPTKLVKNGTTTYFKYGADGMRYKQTKTTGGQTYVTYYVGKGFEREVQPGNKVLEKTYVGNHTTLYKTVSGAPDYPAGVVHSLLDRLGSPSTLIKGRTSSPVVLRYRAHGIFGKPIDAGTGSILDSLSSWDGQYRGYTGHEQLVEQELVHMNGRVYDYNLGRFMSVDPFIQMPESSQSINPYSYIMNNPMAGTDPTGYIARGTNASNWRDSCLDPHGCLTTKADRAIAKYTGSGQKNSQMSFAATKMVDLQSFIGFASRDDSKKMVLHDIADDIMLTREIEAGVLLQIDDASAYHAGGESIVDRQLIDIDRQLLLGEITVEERQNVVETMAEGMATAVPMDAAALAGIRIVNRVTKGGSVLANASTSAFRAADNVASWIPKNKHLLDSTAKRSAKFNTNSFDDVQSIVAEALRSPNARFMTNNADDSFRVVTDLGRTVGSKGQTSVRVIVGNDGKIWNAFPVNAN